MGTHPIFESDFDCLTDFDGLGKNEMGGSYWVIPRYALERDTSPSDELEPLAKRQRQLPSNEVKTTKYSYWNFIPKNLFEQFHRFANVYFVFIGIINFVPQVNAINPYLALCPVIFILGVTALKDGYEDSRRRNSDKEINSQKCRVYSGGAFVESKWRHIRVGDLIKIGLNDVIPADCLLVSSSNPAGICFIETANLDGESNLKQKDVIETAQSVDGTYSEREESRGPFDYILHTDSPNADLNTFKGFISPLEAADDLSNSSHHQPLKNNNLILRGCVLRNTDEITGLVVYCGKNTKAALNNNESRKKVSYLERLMNRDVIWCVVILLILCIICAVASVLWERDNSAWYVPDLSLVTGSAENRFVGVSEMTVRDAFVNGFFIFLTMIILLQILIPISLYVTIEIVKLCQVFFIENDPRLRSAKHNEGVTCRALNLTEELGNIEHVFCDKTGTLTENSMVFRCASIDGVDYRHREQAEALKMARREGKTRHELVTSKASVLSSESMREQDKEGEAHRKPRGHQRKIPEADMHNLNPDELTTTANEDDLETRVLPDEQLSRVMRRPFGGTNGIVRDFFLCLSCCNTVVISVEQRGKNVKN